MHDNDFYFFFEI